MGANILQGSGLKLIIVIIYRPGSVPAGVPFLDEFADILERTSEYAAPLVIVGDVNIHLDEVTMSITEQFHNMLTDCDLVQHVVGPTHTAGHTLDVFISRQSYTVGVDVDLPVISDHSLITGQLTLKTPRTASNTVTRRNWKAFSIDAFKDDLSRSEFLTVPASNDCEVMLERYNRTMEVLLDKHAPARARSVRHRVGSPWFNGECHRIKVTTRRLEKEYRRTKSTDSRDRWRSQFDLQRHAFQEAQEAVLLQLDQEKFRLEGAMEEFAIHVETGWGVRVPSYRCKFCRLLRRKDRSNSGRN